MDPPRILVAHELMLTGEAVAALLAEQRGGLVVDQVEATDLEAALADVPAPIVICAEPTPAVQAGARGWIALYPGDRDVALVGAGDAWRVVTSPTFRDLLAAVDELIASSVSTADLDHAAL